MIAKNTASARRNGSGRLSAEEMERLPDRLLDAATELFLHHGYTGASMDRIARVAGASTKTIYSRYRNKDEILVAMSRRRFERTLTMLVHDVDANADVTDPREFLSRVAAQLATLAASPEAVGMYRLVVSETPRFPDLARMYSEGTGRVVKLLTPLFDRWSVIGRLATDGRSEIAAGQFVDLVIATPRNKAVLGKPLSRAAIKAHLDAAVELFFRGYGP